MNSPKEEDILIINPSVHKTTKLNRKQFLDKVRFVEAIRTMEYNSYLTIYPYDYNEYLLIEQFHDLINKGDFSFFKSSNKHVFGVIVPKALFSWFKNTDLVVIQKQIICWLTSIYVIDDCDWRNKMREDLYNIVFDEVLSVFKNCYPENIDTIAEYSNLKDIYHKACISYTGSLPPHILSDFYFPFYSQMIYKNDEWGLLHFDKHEGSHNFAFFFDSFYFTKTDWEDIVVKNKEDSLLRRAESSPEIWHKWVQAFSLYETRKTHIFSFFSEKQKKGFIYVIRSGDTSEYKIGWSADRNSINERRKSLQTGSPDILTVRAYFPTSSRKTEKVVHKLFEKQHLSGEWFSLTEDQVVNLLNPYWRQKNNIY